MYMINPYNFKKCKTYKININYILKYTIKMTTTCDKKLKIIQMAEKTESRDLCVKYK